MKRILLTGSNGQLGYSCKEDLSEKFDLICTSRSKSKGTLQLDIFDRNAVSNTLKKFQPDIVINLSAFTDVNGCEKNPHLANKINFEGVKNICDNFDGHLIHISSDYVFDGKDGPYDESSTTNPISVYGTSKLKADEYIIKNKSHYTILRANVLYDYHKKTNASFLKWVIESLQQNKAIKVVNDQWNNPTWTRNFYIFILKLIKKKGHGLLNYADNGIMTRYDFALKIANIFDLDTNLIEQIKTKELKQEAKRPMKSGLITKKIENNYNIKPVSVDSSLRSLKKLVFDKK